MGNGEDEQKENENDDLGDFTNCAGGGGTGYLVGVIESSENRRIYPDCEPEFDSCERIEE